MVQVSLQKSALAEASAPSSPVDFQTLAPLIKGLTSSEGLALLGCAALLLFTGTLDKKRTKKGKLAKGRLGNQKEKTAAMRMALKQIEARKHNEAALYLGRPSRSKLPLFLPDAQRGIAVVGGSGTGKTDSALLPAIFSMIDQNRTGIIWDFKYPTLTKRFVGHAAKRGYDVRIFAPGYPESEICNPLDFLEREDPSLMAGQFAVTLNRNFQKAGQQASEDAFFGVAGDQMVQAILMLAKETQFDDIMMCQAILSLTDLPKRLIANRDSINPWVYSNFGTMLASASSEKTVAGIIATANKLFTTFMKPKLLSAFCGKTTIPLELKGKQILVLGLDREKRDVLAPLVAAILDLLVSRNVARERSDPLFLFLDEVPTLYLPRLVNWLNECREDGLCTVLGFQNIVQLEEIYGKGWARAILGACATKILFNPQDAESAEFFSRYFDEEEIHFKQRSRSSGGKGSTTISDQERTKRLISVGEILKLPKGKCIITSPGFESQGEAYVPIVEKIHLSLAYIATKLKSELLWHSIRQKLIKRSPQRPVTAKDLKARYNLSDKLYPLPTQKTKPTKSVHRLNPKVVEGLDVEHFLGMS